MVQFIRDSSCVKHSFYSLQRCAMRIKQPASL